MKTKVDEMFEESGILEVTFTKKDGSKRVMVCTKNLDLIPASSHPKPLKEGETRKPRPPHLCTVYEIDVGWRSFVYENVLEIRKLNV